MRSKYLIAGLALFAALSGAWVLFENTSGRIPEGLSELGHGILYPGWFASVVFLGNMHARFGDWRDFAVLVSVSWITWMIPVCLICRVFTGRKKEPIQQPQQQRP
jgi:4-amino-4-deoxy-L-arabinose transferase-like glycosyltransferase